MEVYTPFFETADGDASGRLDRAEYGVFEGLIKDQHVSDWGAYLEFTDEDLDAFYAAINGLSDEEGISADDYWRRLALASLVYNEIKLKADPITDDERGRFEGLVTALFGYAAELPAEVLEADWAEFLKFENVWVYNNVMVYYKYKDIFAAADGTADGVLSDTEYLDFEAALYQQRVDSYGGFF